MSNKLKAILATFSIFGLLSLMYFYWSDTLMYIMLGTYVAAVALLIFGIVYTSIKNSLDKGSN